MNVPIAVACVKTPPELVDFAPPAEVVAGDQRAQTAWSAALVRRLVGYQDAADSALRRCAVVPPFSPEH